MLVHDRHASRLRVLRRAESGGFAVDQHAALGRGIDPGQQFDAGAFAGAVFPEQRQHFATPQLKRRIAQGDRAAEQLGDSHQSNRLCRIGGGKAKGRNTIVDGRDSFCNRRLFVQFAIIKKNGLQVKN